MTKGFSILVCILELTAAATGGEKDLANRQRYSVHVEGSVTSSTQVSLDDIKSERTTRKFALEKKVAVDAKGFKAILDVSTSSQSGLTVWIETIEASGRRRSDLKMILDGRGEWIEAGQPNKSSRKPAQVDNAFTIVAGEATLIVSGNDADELEIIATIISND